MVRHGAPRPRTGYLAFSARPNTLRTPIVALTRSTGVSALKETSDAFPRETSAVPKLEGLETKVGLALQPVAYFEDGGREKFRPVSDTPSGSETPELAPAVVHTTRTRLAQAARFSDPGEPGVFLVNAGKLTRGWVATCPL